MAFCKACGQELGAAAFCPKCGAAQGAGVGPTGTAVVTVSPTEGLQENVAGLLCYLPFIGWLVAIIFVIIEKRSFVRFHAAQALALYVSLVIVGLALGIFMGVLHVLHIFFIGLLIYPVLWLGSFLLLVFMMFKAYHGERFKLPVVGDMVEGMIK
jgi:uncharacterized membrane protein